MELPVLLGLLLWETVEICFDTAVRCAPHSIEYHRERIELGLFTGDEVTWAFECAKGRLHPRQRGSANGRNRHIDTVQHRHLRHSSAPTSSEAPGYGTQ